MAEDEGPPHVSGTELSVLSLAMESVLFTIVNIFASP